MGAEQLERLVRILWSVHFHVPLRVYWGALLGGTTVAFFSPLVWPFALLAIVGTTGVLRWRWHHRTSFLIVPRFRAERGSEGKADRAQELIIEGLSRELTTAEQSRVPRTAPLVIIKASHAAAMLNSASAVSVAVPAVTSNSTTTSAPDRTAARAESGPKSTRPSWQLDLSWRAGCRRSQGASCTG